MTEFSLLSSRRLSSVLHDALSWPESESITSMLISAKNGSILASAYRDTKQMPGVKALRTKSTTFTTAYTAMENDHQDAGEELLVIGKENSGMSVLIGVGEQVVLAVSSGEIVQIQGPKKMWNVPGGYGREDEVVNANETEGIESEDDYAEDEEVQDSEHSPLRAALESVTADLAGMLRDELKELRWPEDM